MTKCVFASLVVLWLSPSAMTQETGLPRPAILAAKTVAVMGAWGEPEMPGKLGKIVIALGTASDVVADAKGEPIEHSGSYEADPTTAQQKVKDSIRKWGRFTVLDDPTEADLVLVVVVREYSKFGAQLCSSELLVFPGGGIPDQNSVALWQSGDTKALWGMACEYAATKATRKFQKYVQELEKEGHQ